MPRINFVLPVITIFVVITSACSGQSTQVQATRVPTQIVEPGITPSLNLPQSEVDVPRVSVENAKAAFESGAAVIVDVRSPSAYEASHVAGAISIPLGEIESNPAGLSLDKEEWIITYCT